jgi:hypothetical protein
VLICVSFLLAVFLNHTASQRAAAPGSGVPSPANPKVSAPMTQTPPANGGGPKCRSSDAERNLEPETMALLEEQCPGNKP